MCKKPNAGIFVFNGKKEGVVVDIDLEVCGVEATTSLNIA